MRGTAVFSLLLALGGWASYMPLVSMTGYRATMWPMFALLAAALVLALYAFKHATAPALIARLISGVAAVLCLAMAPVFFLMLRVPQPAGRPIVGSPAPGVNVTNEFGDKLFTGSFTGDGPLLLVFYRGFWCISCMNELQGLGEVRDELKRQGGELIAISTDAPEALKAGRKNYPLLPVLLASDESHDAIKAFKLTHDTMGKELPAPATVLIDKKGIVRFAHYAALVSDRPNPKTVLLEVQRLAPDTSGEQSDPPPEAKSK